MKAHNGRRHPLQYWPFFLILALALSAGLLVRPLQTAGAASATYTRGVLYVTIPYHAPQAGAGKLTIEVLNPEDEVLGRAERELTIGGGKGHWQEEIKLDKPLALDDLVWHRVRYRFEYGGENGGAAPIEGVESISEILRTPVVHVLGQQSYMSGGEAAVRLIVTDSKNELIAGGGLVRIELVEGRKSHLLFKGKLNKRGTTEAQMRLPAGLVGSYHLHYVVDTPIGSTEFDQAVRLEDKVSILLTTEKPIYQPGQTIHARALALDRASHEAAANRPLTFEVQDSRGNKVFKKITQTDKFGVASAEFGLADEVNLGTYHLRALLGGDADSPATNTAEIALNVEKYVLPKFKVAIDLAGNGDKAKRGYRPGDHVTGTVHANYFFGKAVDGEVTVKASSMDVSVYQIASVQGKTDQDGSYHFDIPLPAYFAGRPLTQDAARVLIEATVKDSASHAETHGEPITVSESPLLVTAIPEGGTLVPNLENQVFVLASYPDGSPAQADLTIHAADNQEQKASTDAGGVAVVPIKAGDSAETLRIEATDKEGNQSSSSVTLASRQGDDQILLRTERAVYRAGDRIALQVFSTVKRGTAYIDVVKEGQTVLTRDIDIENGRAELTLTAGPEMAGTLDIDAYLFGRDAQPVGDHRLVFVQPADELKIETTTDAAIYKPGDDARIQFRVTNSKGEGVSAALGLQVVDEAVFALAEQRPGFAKVFFYLEQEVMKPRYEIHSIGMPEIVEPVEESKADQRDRAARALFAATEVVNANKFENEFGRGVPQDKYEEYAQRYYKRFTADAHKLAASLTQAFANGQNKSDVTKIVEKMKAENAPEIQDVWGHNFRVDAAGVYNHVRYYIVRSAGPDKQFNTGDDLALYIEMQERKIVEKPKPGPAGIDVDLEHDRGPFNGLAEATGVVADSAGAALKGATVTLREASPDKASSGRARTALVNARGRFSLSGLVPGSYRVTITSPGMETVSADLVLSERDRAILSAHLRGRSQTTIEVQGTAPLLETGNEDVVTVLDSRATENIPLPTRNYGQLTMLSAGAVTAPMEMRQGMVVSGVLGGIVANKKDMVAGTGAGEGSGPAAHVRSYFPEALYINPEIITDKDGRASISIPMADSITTWRMAMLASTEHGALGSATSSIKVFQDFFVDLDLPVTLTQGDRVSIPVAIYNYSGGKGDVDLQLQPDGWYALQDDVADKIVTVDSGQVGGSQFTVQANRIGKFKLTLSARMKGAADRADIVVREIEVVPNGREQNQVFNGRLDDFVKQQVEFPAASIPDASKIFVRFYPGPMSQVVEGMDAILRMPGGCFEQTSSSTYPNVLALDYMKRTKKLTPEVHAKAEGYIANGYQRLLTFEVPGGGFSWFGQAPANKILTAYGLMEFYDMSKVHDVDPNLIARTQQWLAAQQQSDGSWKPDTYFINEGATTRYNTDVMRITAYIAWSLENTGYHGPAVERAREYVEKHMASGKLDSYTLAVLANFAVDNKDGKDRDFTAETMKMLLDARTEKGDQAWWSAEETGVYGGGASASVETTGLAVQALLKWGEDPGAARKALSYIAGKKDAYGTWGSTQATIMALRALLLSTEKGSADVRGSVDVLLNGKVVATVALTPENNDLLQQFVFKGKDIVTSGAPTGKDDADKSAKQGAFGNTVELRFNGKGGLAYQIVGQYFLPWDKEPENEALSIKVDYDRTHLAQDDIATATATVRNNLAKSANMVMVDLGIPPGFDLLSEDLQAYQEKSASLKSGKLEKFSQTATQAILYFDSIGAGDAVKIQFRLRAKYPIRAHTFQSRVYEYYDPDVSSLARPVQLEVKGK